AGDPPELRVLLRIRRAPRGLEVALGLSGDLPPPPARVGPRRDLHHLRLVRLRRGRAARGAGRLQVPAPLPEGPPQRGRDPALPLLRRPLRGVRDAESR